jgi:hypothetical protein
MRLCIYFLLVLPSPVSIPLLVRLKQEDQRAVFFWFAYSSVIIYIVPAFFLNMFALFAFFTLSVILWASRAPFEYRFEKLYHHHWIVYKNDYEATWREEINDINENPDFLCIHHGRPILFVNRQQLVLDAMDTCKCLTEEEEIEAREEIRRRKQEVDEKMRELRRQREQGKRDKTRQFTEIAKKKNRLSKSALKEKEKETAASLVETPDSDEDMEV